MRYFLVIVLILLLFVLIYLLIEVIKNQDNIKLKKTLRDIFRQLEDDYQQMKYLR